MTTGASGTYGFNNVDLTLQPTEGTWLVRKSLGFDGAGHDIYPSVRDFQMSFDLISVEDVQQFNNQYLAVSNSGTVSLDLPEYGASQYQFKSYSGCVLSEPEYGPYFEKYIQKVLLMARNIRTN